MGRFDGRVAVVTGGASGIGLAVAARLVAEGAHAMVWDLDGERLDRCAGEFGAAAACAQLDVSDALQVAAAMEAGIARFGRLDIVVNCAGLVGHNGPFWEATPEQWDPVLQVNLRSAFLVSRQAVPHLRRGGWGRIVNVASVAANEGPANLALYAASKAGMVGLTKSMAKDLAGSGVLVNAIAPALIATELLRQLTAEYLAASVARIPLGRPGTLDEVAAMAAWLCSAESSFSTGAVFDLSGGRGV